MKTTDAKFLKLAIISLSPSLSSLSVRTHPRVSFRLHPGPIIQLDSLFQFAREKKDLIRKKPRELWHLLCDGLTTASTNDQRHHHKQHQKRTNLLDAVKLQSAQLPQLLLRWKLSVQCYPGSKHPRLPRAAVAYGARPCSRKLLPAALIQQAQNGYTIPLSLPWKRQKNGIMTGGGEAHYDFIPTQPHLTEEHDFSFGLEFVRLGVPRD